MTNHRIVPTVAISLLLAIGSSAGTESDVPDAWQTVAEQTDFRATSSFDQTIELLRRIDAASPDIELEFFGRSGAGRLLPVVVVSGRGAFTPAAAKTSGQPVLLLQSCIHAGEVDGKDASLIILRDMALGRRPIPKNTIVLFAPIFNADGHERVSALNRANQNGPVEGMGFRTTANGINLNRDHMRVATVEMRGLLDLFNRWRPQLHVDIHVTNGSDHAWVLTWMVAEAPAIAPSVDRWLATRLPPVLAATKAAGHLTGPYVDLRNPGDPTEGFAWLPISPRYSTDYFPLRNRPSILIEMHAHKPYADRVLATRDFLLSLIDAVEQDPASLVRAVAEAEDATVAKGRADAKPSMVVVQWSPSVVSETVTWPAATWSTEPSVVTGRPLVRFRAGTYEEILVPWFHGHLPELELIRPRGYLVMPGWPQIERLISEHGLTAWRLPASVELDVETIRVADPVLLDLPFQGTVPVQEFSVTRQPERRTIPAGAVWVPADQPDFEVAVQLFEPEAPDSMLRWGSLSTVFERKEYIGLDTLEGLTREMLIDEANRRAWEAALQDEAFAADARARYLWWYRRSPYWDEQVGLLPVFRVMQPPTFESSIRAFAFADSP